MSSHRRRRVFSAAILIGLIGMWAPARVDARADFKDAPATVAADSDIALTLFVEDERDEATYNERIAIRLPEGWTGLACESKPTWTCTIVVESQRVVIRYTKDEGAAPAEDETFNITLHSGTNLGTATFPILQTYNTGEEVGWIGDPGLDNEAPTLEVAGVAPATPPAETTTIPPTTTVAPTPAPTTLANTLPPTSAPSTAAASTTTTGAPTDTAVILAPTVTQPSEAESDGDSANTIIVIALVLAAAGAAMYYYWKQRKAPIPPA